MNIFSALQDCFLVNASGGHDQAAPDLLFWKAIIVLQSPGNALFLGIGKTVDRWGAIARQEIPVNESAYIKVLQTGPAEVPPILIVQELRNSFFVKSRLQISQGDWGTCPIPFLFFRPAFVCQPVHLVQEIARRCIILFRTTDLHETSTEENALPVHFVRIGEIGKTRQEGAHVASGRIDSRLPDPSQILSENFMDGTERIAERRGRRAVVQSIPQDVIQEDQLMIESIHSKDIGTTLPHSSFPPIPPVEVLCIGHPRTAGEDHRLSGESIQMHVSGHLGIRQDFGISPVALDCHDVDEHPVIRLVPEHHLVVRGETNAVRLFHMANQRKKIPHRPKNLPELSFIPLTCKPTVYLNLTRFHPIALRRLSSVDAAAI